VDVAPQLYLRPHLLRTRRVLTSSDCILTPCNDPNDTIAYSAQSSPLGDWSCFKQALNHISFLAWPSTGCILTLTLIPAFAQQAHNTSSASRLSVHVHADVLSCLVLSLSLSHIADNLSPSLCSCTPSLSPDPRTTHRTTFAFASLRSRMEPVPAGAVLVSNPTQS
jgi:hypothetical protein